MITTNTDLKHTLLSNYKTVEGSLNGTSNAIRERRQDAINKFETLGFPTTKNEEWKYTNLANALKHDFSFNVPASVSKADIDGFLLKDIDAHVIVFINGVLSKELSKISTKDNEIEIKSFAEADATLLEKYFSKNLSINDSFTYLNTAFAQSGSYIRVHKGKAIEKPIVLHFITDARTSNVFYQPRNLFVAEENSEVKIIETYNTLGDNPNFNNIVTEIVLEKDARVECYKIQNESLNTFHVETTQVHQEGKSHFAATTITLGGSITRNNLNIVLNSEYSEAFMYGLSLTNGTQHVDNHTIADHAKPNCESNELYKSILNDKSVGVFNGKIFVKQDAQKTNAFQSNKSILLSKDATMNTKPQLEIFADDVKCSHGATIGQLDEEPLFYLRSRGISEDKARALLIMAFAQDIVEHIQIDSLKELLLNIIAERIEK